MAEKAFLHFVLIGFVMGDWIEISKSDKSDLWTNNNYENEPFAGTKVGSAMMLFVKRIQHQLLDFQGKSIEAKLNHLSLLRNDILHDIKYRISRLFKPADTSESRLLDSNDDNHLDYPSNEGALMTIGFLTFAVFLIKLVMKLIYTLKLKQQHYYQTTTTPVSIFLKRDDPDQEEHTRIIKSIKKYTTKLKK